MKTFFETKHSYKILFFGVAIIIAAVSLVVSDTLIRKLEQEEREKVEIWVNATQVMTSENPTLDMNLILKIIEGNNSIPVLVCNERNEVLHHRNVEVPKGDVEAFFKEKIAQFRSQNRPIIIDMEDGTYQYFYYDDSIILKRLMIYPYIQLGIVSIFILIAFIALISTKKAEQNKVWVGLSKETAHQLGTPISSLIAWMEYLRSKDIEASILGEMEKDVKRLEMIAERFSKIGSNPKPQPVDIRFCLEQAVDYMRTRISKKVLLHLPSDGEPLRVLLNEALFGWVVENLIKNAVDAMEGKGEIHFRIEDRGSIVRLDVSDTGKGIPKSKFKQVFSPGFTTKKRGWGLGLSLVKRIVESSPRGKIYVLSSEQGKGTTFRIELQKEPLA